MIGCFDYRWTRIEVTNTGQTSTFNIGFEEISFDISVASAVGKTVAMAIDDFEYNRCDEQGT